MSSEPNKNGPNEPGNSQPQDDSEPEDLDRTLELRVEKTLLDAASDQTMETSPDLAKQQNDAQQPSPAQQMLSAAEDLAAADQDQPNLTDSDITIDSIKSLIVSNEFHGDTDQTTDSVKDDRADGTIIQGSFGHQAAAKPPSKPSATPSPPDHTEATLAPSQTGRSRMTANPTDATIASQAAAHTNEDDDEFLIVGQTKSRGEDIPKTIGRYSIKRLLGEGAFGRVYEAHDPQLDRRVAVKVAKQISGNTQVQRFLREARAAAKLRHPNIIPVYEYGQVDDENIIVYEFVAGETLKSYIRRHSKLPLDETVEIIRDIASGLDYAHEEGIVHRDMKPDNVLIDKYGKPHIADFGCARSMDDQTNLTIDGSILGTPMYMSPEQASGNSNTADGRTDIWSLGVMLYEMVSGERPFRGSLTDLLYWICNNDAKPLGKINPETPADIETICAKCLTRELDGRFPTAKTLADELDRFQRGEPILSRPIGPLQRTWMWAKRNQTVAGLLATVAATLLIGSAVSTSFAVKAYREQRSRAFTQLNALQTSEPAAIKQIFEDLIPFRSSILPILKEQLADEATEPSAQRRLRMAILALEADTSIRESLADNMVEDLLTSDAGDFAVCRESMAFRKNHLRESLWKTSLDADETNPSETRFRAATALALYDPQSPNWKTAAPDVTAHLTSLSQIEAAQWLPSLRPVPDELKSSLINAFIDQTDGDDTTAIKAATIIALLFEDQSGFLVDLIPKCRNGQIPPLIKSLSNDPIEAIEKLQSRLDSISESENASASDHVLQIANLATALIQLQDSYQWHYFNSRPNNSVASQLIEQLGPAGTPFELLSEQVKLWRSSEADLVSGAILALGQFRQNQIREKQRLNLKPTLLTIFSEHSDARVHSSARWLLQQWGFEDEIQRREKQLRRATPDPQKNWHVDLLGNTFVLFGPIESFQMGLNKDLAAISSFDPTSILDETRHSKRVPRRFGISTHEITIEQFEEFEEELIGMFERQVEAYKSQISKLKSSPVVSNEEQPERDDTKKESSKSAKQSKAKRIKAFENGIRRAKLKIENIARNQKRRVGLDQRVPIGEVDFYLSLGYCRWLSEKNGLSSGLPSVEKLQDFYDAGISDFWLDESNLSLNGYRLPTTSEWEFACRGNSDTIFPFGTNTELADRYAWFASNSGDSRHPVGRLKPGTTGLFDMLGNASEWCLDYYRKDLPALSAELGREYFVDFGPEFARRRSLTREFRGGSFANEIKDVRSTKRFSTHPGKGLPRIGFRLVRTYEAQSPAN